MPIAGLAKDLKARLIVSIAAGTLVAGCVPDLGAAPIPKPIASYETGRAFTAPLGDWPADQWWRAYHDVELNRLIEEALAGAPDLRIAEARLTQAIAAAQQTGAAAYPSLTADGTAAPTKASLNQGFPAQFKSFLPRGWHTNGRVTANLQYDLDFFGKNRALLAAATSQEDAARVEVAAARIEIATSVASAYGDLVRLSADREAAQDAVRVREDSARLVGDRVTNQLENSGQLSQARSAVSSAQGDLDAVEGQIALTRSQIAALLGKGPDRGLEIPLPVKPKLHPFGVPPTLAADLIGRRPDIVSARLQAEAAAQRIKAAKADFYPNINLSGYIGYQSLDIGDLLQKDSLIGQIGPAIHLPIFDGGQIEGAYRSARGQYDEAVANYDKTLTGALHEVADALANQRELTSELAHGRAALKAIEDAYRVAQERYRAGLSRFQDVLTAEDALLQDRRKVADLEARAFAQDIALVRALGGGFSAPGSTQTVSLER